jgi:hypothetical protein
MVYSMTMAQMAQLTSAADVSAPFRDTGERAQLPPEQLLGDAARRDAHVRDGARLACHVI